MKISSLFQELKEKDFYRDFIKQNPDAFLMAGFFIFDYDADRQQIHLDFFLPKEKKIASFEYPFSGVKIHPDEMKSATQLSLDLKVDVNNIKDEVEKQKEKTKPGMKINKLIAILKDNNWNTTLLSNSLDIIRVCINAVTGESIKCENLNLGDFMKISKGKK